MKLTRAQLKDIREKFKDERSDDGEDESNYSVTQEDRRAIRQQKSNETISVQWNIKVGDLVYLPDATIGLIVKIQNGSDDQASLRVSGMYKGQEKAAIREAKQKARCYVIAPSGKKWYNPSRLKKVDS